MALSKSVFIDRANRASARTTFDGAANTMRQERQSVFIFPEGTRSYAEKPDMLPFKKGAFHLAIQAQVPIVPVVVANYSDVLNLKKKMFNKGVIDVSGMCNYFEVFVSKYVDVGTNYDQFFLRFLPKASQLPMRMH